VLSYFLAFAGFAALVILHELGHFAAAKAVGMRVERFSLFFPPLIWRWRPKGSETEYAIGAIPLGGYVKISGMSPHEELPAEVAPRAYLRQKVWKRIVVISAGPAVNIVLAFLILWGLYTLTTLGFTQPAVDKVTAGSPAAKVLKPGDRILSVDGRSGYTSGLRPEDAPERVSDLMGAIRTHGCKGKVRVGCSAEKPVRMEVLRDGRTLRFELVPRFELEPLPPKGEPRPAGKRQGRMLVGLQFATQPVDFGPLGAARYSVKTM
jgi:regulator of sigma E protease